MSTSPEERLRVNLVPDKHRSDAAVVQRPVVMPPIDIYESRDGLVLIADMPGVSIQSLELQVQDNRLSLYGRVAPPASENSLLRHQEYQDADFLRSFILSEEVDHNRISARLANGVLEVTLPRLPKSPPRKITVTTE